MTNENKEQEIAYQLTLKGFIYVLAITHNAKREGLEESIVKLLDSPGFESACLNYLMERGHIRPDA